MRDFLCKESENVISEYLNKKLVDDLNSSFLAYIIGSENKLHANATNFQQNILTHVNKELQTLITQDLQMTLAKTKLEPRLKELEENTNGVFKVGALYKELIATDVGSKNMASTLCSAMETQGKDVVKTRNFFKEKVYKREYVGGKFQAAFMENLSKVHFRFDLMDAYRECIIDKYLARM